MVLPNGNGGDIIAQMRGQIGAAHAKLNAQEQYLRQMAGESALQRQQVTLLNQKLGEFSSLLANARMGGSASGGGAPMAPANIGQVGWQEQVLYINEIPGRRIPWDLVVSIPIGANVSSTQPGTMPISQDGPFIAVARMATFQSTHTFSMVSGGNTVTLNGRSHGRYRPIHSTFDFMDSQAFMPVVGAAFPGGGNAIYASPTNHSGFRTMEFDGTIMLQDSGSAWFRGNQAVPTAFWTDGLNSAFQLGALDFFERGSTIQALVTPNHVNNPQGGNVNGFMAGAIYPDISSQYDVHEGILDPYVVGGTVDPCTRIPDGILTIVLHGFKILQPPGPVRMS